VRIEPDHLQAQADDRVDVRRAGPPYLHPVIRRGAGRGRAGAGHARRSCERAAGWARRDDGERRKPVPQQGRDSGDVTAGPGDDGRRVLVIGVGLLGQVISP